MTKPKQKEEEIDYSKLRAPDLRKILVSKRYCNQMEADEITGKAALVNHHKAMLLGKKYRDVNVKQIVEIKTPPARKNPEYLEPGWSERVLAQLLEDEYVIDEKGTQRPKVKGLRRLTEILLGDILNSTSHVVSCSEYDGVPLRQWAVVEHEIKLKRHGTDDIKTVRDVAEVNHSNTDDQFLRYPVATASTRAEARALRKALYLYNIVTDEEVTDKDIEDLNEGWNMDEEIQDSQINTIDKICKRLDVNVMAFINSGSRTYEYIKDVTKGTASKMLKELNELQREAKKIPEAIKGFDENWQSEVKE